MHHNFPVRIQAEVKATILALAKLNGALVEDDVFWILLSTVAAIHVIVRCQLEHPNKEAVQSRSNEDEHGGKEPECCDEGSYVHKGVLCF